MGKVGSTTVASSLIKWGIDCQQIHYLNTKSIDGIERAHISKGLKVPDHVYRSREVLNGDLLSNDDVKVITLVRDPVARNISAFFQNLQKYFPKESLDEIEQDELIETFLKSYSHNVSIDWFDREIKENLHIDVTEEAVDKTKSFFTLKKSNIKLLILKVESTNEEKLESILSFLELNKNHVLTQGNIGSEKSYSKLYRGFKEKIVLPKEYLDKMYNSKLISHLYTSEEILTMRNKWEKTAES
jgi:hypothetical protein